MAGRSVVRATCSGDFSSAMRRRTSPSTVRSSRSTRAAAVAMARASDLGLPVVAALHQRLGEPQHQAVGRQPLQGVVRRPRREPAATVREVAVLPHRVAGQLLDQGVVAGGHRLGELVTQLAQLGCRVAGALAALSRIARVAAELVARAGGRPSEAVTPWPSTGG